MLDDRPAGFCRRAAALAIDGGFVAMIVGLGQLAAHPFRRHDLAVAAFLRAWTLVLPGAYLVLTHASTGQTIGKWVMGARLETLAGSTVGPGRAVVRLVATLVAALVPLGLLSVAWRRDKRGWHDRLAGTRVVRLS